MNESEIEAHRREDVTWRRPSWPFGARRSGYANGGGPDIRDDFGVFREDGWGDATGAPESGAAFRALPEEERKALAVMDLEYPLTSDELRSRYKELVKLLHPDANGGDKEAEERLKLINQAYTTLKNGDCLQWQTR